MTPGERGRERPQQRAAALFFAVIPVTITMDRFLDLVIPGPVIAGHWQAAFAIDVLGAILAVVLFALWRPADRWNAPVTVCLTTFLLLWALALGLSASEGESLSATAILVPLAIALPSLKRPPSRSILLGTDMFAWALVATSAASLVLEVGGVVPSWYGEGAISDAWIAVERHEYWMPLADILGLPGRWAGPYGHPSLAGPVGAFLVVYGLSRMGIRRVVFVVAGVAILLLAASRTSLLVTFLGVLVLVVSQSGLKTPRRAALLVGTGALAAFVVGSAYLVWGNPNLTGRGTIWPQYLLLWRESPLTGVGTRGIWDAIGAGTLPAWASHAHNLGLDTLTRMGILGLTVAVALLAQIFVIAFRAARMGDGVGLALVALTIFGTTTDTLIDWRFASPTLMVLLLSVLLSGWASSPPPPEPDEAGSSTPADQGLGLR